MPYNIEFRKRAIKEYIEATAWYKERSLTAAENFVLFVEQAIHKIKSQPNDFRVSYKNYHEAKIKNYPFNMVYFVEEDKKV